VIRVSERLSRNRCPLHGRSIATAGDPHDIGYSATRWMTNGDC
jgi:hypothetical protein